MLVEVRWLWVPQRLSRKKNKTKKNIKTKKSIFCLPYKIVWVQEETKAWVFWICCSELTRSEADPGFWSGGLRSFDPRAHIRTYSSRGLNLGMPLHWSPEKQVDLYAQTTVELAYLRVTVLLDSGVKEHKSSLQNCNHFHSGSCKALFGGFFSL